VAWTKEQLVPLLRRVGFRRVDITHGVLESGRDVIFADYDRFGLQKFYAAQVKYGDLKARSWTQEIRTIVDQANNAYDTPYRDLSTGTEHRIAGVYLIVNGTITEAAKSLLYPKTGNWFSIIDANQLGVADMLVPHISDCEWHQQYLFLKNEVRKNLETAVAALDPENGLLGDGDTLLDTVLPGAMMGLRWVERVLDTAINDLNRDDFILLQMYLDKCALVNYLVMKIPIGESNEFIQKSVVGLRDTLSRLRGMAPYVLALCEHVRNGERPEPGRKFVRSPKTTEYKESLKGSD